jgi:predicted dehydrogenase
VNNKAEEVTPVRFGILGAARIAPAALIEPARKLDGVEVTAIASRSQQRADRFAADHGVPATLGSYEALLERSDVDVVYVALPVSAHYEWSRRALLAGKHVLCQKAMTMNAGEAEDLVNLAESSGLILAEAMHYRYHPLMLELIHTVKKGDIGRIERAEASTAWTSSPDAQVFWDSELGGGSLRHDGCYGIHCLRTLIGAEPEVSAVEATWSAGVDASLVADLRFPDGATGRVSSSIVSSDGYKCSLFLGGSGGEVRIDNYLQPGNGSALLIRTEDGERLKAFGPPSTHIFHITAFVESVRSGKPVATSGADIVGNARVIDAIFEAARAIPAA